MTKKNILEYNHLKIEKKWQKEWEKKKIYEAKNHTTRNTKQKKFFGLIEFPYPSGAGLHVGHIRSNTAMDIISRKRRMEGHNVLYPIGWDAFGLPTENYAIKTGIHPAIVTKKNTDTFRKQLKELGFSFDWSREINTTDPAYYKWTQWIFLQMFKKGLAYKQKTEINWCPSCKIGLANEEAVGGICDRCGGVTTKKEKEQWMLGITKYADRLDKDLDKVNYLEKIKIQQRNWIGKSEGSEIRFKIKVERLKSEDSDLKSTNLNLSTISVFTTRADTLFGATYVVLAPEHSIITNYKLLITNWKEVEGYIENIKNKTEIERTAEGKVKTGIELKGVKAINPATNEEIPVWIADYVLASYGTGAVMAVPAHDERDYEFAKKYNLPVKEVVSGGNIKEEAFIEDGILINSGKFNGVNSDQARKEITKFVGGKIVTKYKLRDWVFSRQRYWGEPIPLIFCERCAKNHVVSRKKDVESMGEKLNPGWFPVKENKLPVILPKVKSYKPTDTGESPLAQIKSWVNTTCPKCGGRAKRETDTMPNWAGSSWYFLRYVDPKNKKEFASKKNLEYWCKLKPNTKNQTTGPVDWYNGGMEHTTLHLLYSRFWHKFLYDLKLVPTSEPYMKRTSHGMILAEGGEKMSKSKGNVINPDQIVKLYGADTLRIYEMFLGPFDQAVSWSTESIIGSRRFLEKVWRIGQKIITNDKLLITNYKNNSHPTSPLVRGRSKEGVVLETILNKTIKKVTEDIEGMNFNTAISAMMVLVNEIEKVVSSKEYVVSKEDFTKFLQILAPFAPHVTEELYEQLMITDYKLQITNGKNNPHPTSPLSRGRSKEGVLESIHLSKWPKWDPKKIIEDEIKIAIQVNGKVRAEVLIGKDANEETAKSLALENEIIKNWVNNKEIKKFIYVPGRIINIVI